MNWIADHVPAWLFVTLFVTIVMIVVVGIVVAAGYYLPRNPANVRFWTAYDNCIVEKAGQLQGRSLRDYCEVIGRRAR